MDPIYQALAQATANSEATALCTVVKSEGSTPRHVGSKMLVYSDGHFLGTVGGGDLEHRVLDEARLAMGDGAPRLLHYNMADPSRGDPGVCGGQVEVFVEPVLPPPMLVVIGAGHVGKAVAHLAKWLGFPDADAFYACPMQDLASKMTIDRRTFLVLTTRGSSVDAAGMPALLATPAAYIGVIGSKRRWATTVKQLQADGVSAESIARVHSPMGLELRAETPEEIAV